MKTAIIEKYSTLGGTCLNVGCIPSKALLDSSEHFYKAKHEFDQHGIGLDSLKVDMEQMIKRKADVVKTTCDGIDFLMKKNKIDVYHGFGSFKDKNTIQIKGEKDTQEITSEKIVIATGSKPIIIPGVEYDKKRVITSTEALELKEVPKKFVVIGGGVIGLELGSVYARLGAEVTVIEFADRLITGMDGALGKELQRSLKKLGFKFHMKTKVQSAVTEGDIVKIKAEDNKGKTLELEADYCLVAVGRRAYTDGLNLQNAGVHIDDRGKVEVDDHLRTKVDNIYAIGDVIRGAMLAHKAEEEGVFVAESIANQKPHINYKLIPGVVYTWPEVAGVGFTEEELKEAGRKYKVGSFPMRALGRSRASNDLDGLIKVLADQETDEILGVHMIGARVADLIAEAVVAMEYRASAEDVSRMSHAHPTYAEAMKEACLAATGDRPLHI
jgi:dihydrolipoamide dehydrogenase